MIEDEELDNLLKKKEQNSSVSKFTKSQEENSDNTVDTKNLVQKGVDSAVVHQLKNSEEVQERFLQAGKKVVDTSLSAIENRAEADEKAAILQNNKDACDLYGIDEKTVPKWVVGCAKKVQDFWYAIWLIIGFFTTVPIVFLGKKIKVVLKTTWVSMMLAVLIYAAATTSPLWLKLLQG